MIASNLNKSKLIEKKHEKIESRIRIFKLLAVVLIMSGLAVGIFGIYDYHISVDKEKKLSDLGEFLGGTTGSLWSLAGLIFIYVAFLGQKQQLLYQQEDLTDLKLQRFESTFLELVKLRNDIISRTNLHSDDGTILKGLDCFKHFYSVLEKKFKFYVVVNVKELYPKLSELQQFTGELDSYSFQNESKLDSECILEIIDQCVNEVMVEFQGEIEAYFRHLYYMLKYIDRNQDFDDILIYSNLLRAQLTAFETHLIFYLCLSSHGNKNFKKRVENQHFLKNITHELLINTKHKEFFSSSAFGKE